MLSLGARVQQESTGIHFSAFRSSTVYLLDLGSSGSGTLPPLASQTEPTCSNDFEFEKIKEEPVEVDGISDDFEPTSSSNHRNYTSELDLRMFKREKSCLEFFPPFFQTKKRKKRK